MARRILHVMLSERPWGIARVVCSLARAQSRWAEVLVAANEDLGPHLRLVPQVRFVPLPIKFGGAWPSSMALLQMFPSLRRAAKLIDSVGADVVHFHLPNGLAVALLSSQKRTTVYTVHGDFFENRLLNWLQFILMPLILRRADRTTTISKYALRPKWLLGRAVVLPNGLDSEEVISMAGDNSEPKISELLKIRESGIASVIIFPGILIARKGQELAIRSLPYLLRSLPRAAIAFIGEGPDKNSLVRLARELGVQSNVFFLGYAHNQYPLILGSDLILSHLTPDWPLPSLVELESICLRRPVITLRTDEKAKLYRDCGFFTTKEDAKELADKILDVLSADRAKSRDCQDLLREFDWEKVSQRYYSIYCEAGMPDLPRK